MRFDVFGVGGGEGGLQVVRAGDLDLRRFVLLEVVVGLRRGESYLRGLGVKIGIRLRVLDRVTRGWEGVVRSWGVGVRLRKSVLLGEILLEMDILL